MLFRNALTILTCIVMFCTFTFADTESMSAEKDGTLYQSNSGSLANSRGEYLFVGNTNQGQTRRALVFFDIAENVPAGSVITRVELTLNMNQTIAGSQQIQLRKVSKNWGEGSSDATGEEGRGTASTQNDATWIHTFYDTSQWDTPGGDFSSTVSASISVAGNGNYTWGSTQEMVNDVQGWLDSPGSNFGWILIGNESTDPTAKRFASRENDESSIRPRLLVEYEPGAVKNERLYFAQFADGDGIFSQITLFNPGQSDANADIAINDREGQPFQVDLNGELVNGATSITVPAGGVRQLSTDGDGSLKVGSVAVVSDLKLNGVVLFGGAVGLAGVGSSQALSNGFSAPMESNSGQSVNTGIAIMNIESEGATVDLELFDADGASLATAQISVPANGQRALFVSEIDWNNSVDLSNFIGVLKASSTSGIGATVVQTRPGQFATLPVNAN
jgi:hypothetical protein